ncbi:MAG: hypothetical protein U1D69_07270 [Polynucleobacter sp.]|nr:hypothetical protein [Polynucleobacter sp.]
MQWDMTWDDYQIFEAICNEIQDDAIASRSDSALINYILRSQSFVTLLDAQSAIIAHPGEGNGARYKRLLNDFCDWPNASKVCAHHLSHLLRQTSDLAFDPVKTYLEKYEFEPDALVRTPNSDPTYDDVASHFPTDSAGKPRQITFSKADGSTTSAYLGLLKHDHLFWLFRNAIVHNFKSLGRGLGIPTQYAEPIYFLSLRDEEDAGGNLVEVRSTELFYPMKFLKRLVASSSSNVLQHCRAHGINPMESMRSNTYWVEQLNL